MDLAGFAGVIVSPGVPINRHPLADAAREAGEPPRHGVLRRGSGHAQGQVDAAGLQVDQLVGQDQFAGQARLLRGQARHQRRHVQAAEGVGGADAQHAVRLTAQVAHGQMRGGHALQRGQCVLVKHLPRRRQRQAARAPLQQGGAKGGLQLGHLPTDLGARAAQQARGAGHAAGLDHPDEGLPRGQPGHGPVHGGQTGERAGTAHARGWKALHCQ